MTKGEPLQLEGFSREGDTQGEVRLYCWLDATLRELVDLLKESVGVLRESNVELALYSIYQAPDGTFVRKRLGKLESYRRGKEDFLELRSQQFKPGDFLNLVIGGRHAAKERADEQLKKA